MLNFQFFGTLLALVGLKVEVGCSLLTLQTAAGTQFQHKVRSVGVLEPSINSVLKRSLEIAQKSTTGQTLSVKDHVTRSEATEWVLKRDCFVNKYPKTPDQSTDINL